MKYVYWKQFDNKNYSFEEALSIIKNNNINEIQMRVLKPNSHNEIRIDKDNLPQNDEDIELPLWAFSDQYWHLYVPDYEMEDKVDKLRDYLESVYDVDSRFYDIRKMDISEIFSQLDDHVLNDDLRMEIIFWLRDNNKIQQKY